MVRFLLLFFLFLTWLQNRAQCVSSFPYTEDFEAGNGNWQSGGTGDDWTWGQVSKSVISQAASGSNCWVTGGLTASFYNFGQRSYLQSPCFDFSSLQYPFITFNIFWETEKNYDGANLQYSLDNGLNWTNLGQYNEQVFCTPNNWYNTPGVSNLSGLATVREGWSGNMQSTQGSCLGGNGSNGWKKAEHCLLYLAGEPSVSFRFTFGAGTTCNEYDGVAVDDISISEGPSNTADFSYSCTGSSFSFSGTATPCPADLQWNFGDPGSGSSNITSGFNASHTFSNPGNYNVNFTVSGYCNAAVTVTKPVRVTGISISVEDVSCFGNNDGKVWVTVNDSGSFSYTWSTPGGLNDTAYNLVAGTYTVTVSTVGLCDVTASAAVSEPAPLRMLFTVLNESCTGLNDGSVSAIALGGTMPYNFEWDNSETTLGIVSVAPGSYFLTVTDGNSCISSDSAIVSKEICPDYIYFPTAFSPDNDGNNDFFRPKYSSGLQYYFIRIYNRWGNLVYSSTNVNEGWDGTFEDEGQPLGAYVWYAEYSFDGDNKTTQAGNVTLLK